ncbi:MAG TPA: ABC transporter substrate-binding protein [Candidatus Nanopelagicales bacterium]|nr:ABC transporter substrate-binding protein [Candidatus Nanopelagicales bacterium]
MSVRPSRRTAAVVGGIAAALLLAACGSSSDGGGSSASATNTDPACKDYAQYGSHPNTTVTVFTSILPPEQQKFETAWAQFEKCTGISVKYEGSDQFEAQLPTRIAGGNAPDIAFIPQPGLLAKLVNGDNGPVAAPEGVAANMDKWNAQWKTYGTVDGTFYAAPLGSNMKSLVWYSPSFFKAKGYTVPTTWAEMMSLSDKMAADGVKPWCGGIESGGATGWPATDWLEQVVLGTQGGDVYDQWIAHTVKFDSPQITAAMNTVAGWMKNPKYVNAGIGDVKTIATTAFQDAGKPILTNKCGMLQQASFYAAQWPSFKKDVKIAEDGDIFAFYLPQQSDSVKTPIVGGGEFVTAFSDKPEVQSFQTFLSSSLFASEKVKLGGWVSANSGVDLSLYQDPISKLSAEYLTKTDATFRFDASDLMPAAVGAGAEWKQLTAWFATDQSTQTTLQNIDAAWPAS